MINYIIILLQLSFFGFSLIYLCSGSKYEPVPKFGHHTTIVGEKLYLWGGWQKEFPEVHSSDEKTHLTSTVDVFNLHKGEWEKVEIFGQPPLGVRGYVCTAVGSDIYYFGGYCGHDWCRHCSLRYEKKCPLKYSLLFNNLLGKTFFNAKFYVYFLMFHLVVWIQPLSNGRRSMLLTLLNHQ